MFLKDKKLTPISNSASSKDIKLANVDFSASNLARLQSQLSFFSYLNINGEISDQAFEALVRYACSIFIENEVEARVQNALEEKFIKFWESKFFYAMDKYITTK